MFRHRRAQEVLTVAAGFALHVCGYLLGVVLCMKVIIYKMRMRPRRNISCLLICSLPLWRVTSHIYDRVVTYYITTASHHHSYSGPRVPGSAASTDAGRWDNSGFRYKLQGRCSGMQSCSSVYRMQCCRSVYRMQHSICMFWAPLADNQSARLPLELSSGRLTFDPQIIISLSLNIQTGNELGKCQK